MKIKAIVHEAEEGGFWAEVPAIKENFSALYLGESSHPSYPPATTTRADRRYLAGHLILESMM